MPSKDTVSTAAVVLLAACAVLLTGMNVRNTIAFRAPGDPIRSISDWHTYAEGRHRIGPADSRVTIVMFSDYECPACKAAIPHIRAIHEKYPTEVSVIVRHFPIPGHLFARRAAEAAVCAGEQGRFAEFDHVLFARTEELGEKSWANFAVQAGVPDSAEFAECLQDGRASVAVQEDIDLGTRLGVSGTPTLLINGDLYVGVAGLEKIVQRHLRKGIWHRWFSLD
jgi:protein-disulfide isomerase